MMADTWDYDCPKFLREDEEGSAGSLEEDECKSVSSDDRQQGRRFRLPTLDEEVEIMIDAVKRRPPRGIRLVRSESIRPAEFRRMIVESLTEEEREAFEAMTRRNARMIDGQRNHINDNETALNSKMTDEDSATDQTQTRNEKLLHVIKKFCRDLFPIHSIAMKKSKFQI